MTPDPRVTLLFVVAVPVVVDEVEVDSGAAVAVGA